MEDMYCSVYYKNIIFLKSKTDTLIPGMLPLVEKVELNPGIVREFRKTLCENKTVI